jgi:hypothetical protein
LSNADSGCSSAGDYIFMKLIPASGIDYGCEDINEDDELSDIGAIG